MRFVLEIECDNEAFADDPAQEVREIVAGLLDATAGLPWSYCSEAPWPLRDHNGNTVGRAVFRER